MARFKLLIEFDGTDYAGWQRQKNAPSIQEAIEQAILAFCGEQANLVGAGRTDAGVHARAMAAHVDIDRPVEPFRLGEALNFYLKPAPIAILEVSAVSDQFHARFSCTARHYEYLIYNRRAPLTLERAQAWRITQPLDHQAMNEAAQVLVGKHDFTTFRAAQCQSNSPVKTLSAIGVERSDDWVKVRCHAPSFLHHQVRSIVGCLVEVGRGSWTVDDLAGALKKADRAACAMVAPATGLYFMQADYPNSVE